MNPVENDCMNAHLWMTKDQWAYLGMPGVGMLIKALTQNDANNVSVSYQKDTQKVQSANFWKKTTSYMHFYFLCMHSVPLVQMSSKIKNEESVKYVELHKVNLLTFLTICQHVTTSPTNLVGQTHHQGTLCSSWHWGHCRQGTLFWWIIDRIYLLTLG